MLAWIFAYNSGHLGFWLEMAGVSAFGGYWLVKTVELRWSQVEHKALVGLLELNPRTLTWRRGKQIEAQLKSTA